MKLLSGLLVIVASTLQSQSIYDLFGTDQFHRAYLEGNNDEVTFDSFRELKLGTSEFVVTRAIKGIELEDIETRLTELERPAEAAKSDQRHR